MVPNDAFETCAMAMMSAKQKHPFDAIIKFVSHITITEINVDALFEYSGALRPVVNSMEHVLPPSIAYLLKNKKKTKTKTKCDNGKIRPKYRTSVPEVEKMIVQFHFTTFSRWRNQRRFILEFIFGPVTLTDWR